MSNLNRHPVRRTAAGVLAGALALSGAVVAATPASAAAGFTLERIAGADRYETSALTAARFDQAAAVTNVIVASGENGRAADALGASFLAGVRGAPVLLTPQAGLAATTRAALTSLRANGATSVTIVGGPAAVSAAVEAQITALGFTVNRLGGVDRFQTAELVVAAGEVAAAGNTGVASNVGIVASGISTVDALAVGPLAYKGRHPICLTRAAGISASTIASMRANGVTSVYIVGGETVVSANVRTQLTAAGITVVDRLAGQTRSGTSVAIANAIIGGTFGFTNTTFNVASGANDGVDALSGAALSGLQNRALLITDTATSAGAVTAFATARAATLNAPGIIFGGFAAVTQAVETEIETAGGGTGMFQTIAVTPSDTATLTVVNDTAPAANVTSDDRTYTVSGLTAGATYRITLVNNSSIQTSSTGGVTFLSSADAGSASGFSVDVGPDIADIISVNNATPTFAAPAAGQTQESRSTTVVPVAGSITFTINGTAPGSVTPVIYLNGGTGGTATTGGTSTRLETSATAATVAAGTFSAPTETFGVGGTTIYVAPQAQSGFVGGNATGQDATTQATVTGVDKTANTFTTGVGGATVRFNFDANDLFSVDGVSVGLEAFRAALSSDDQIRGTFTRDVAGVSQFFLTDRNPPTPTAVTADNGAEQNSNDITVTVTFPANEDVDSVVVQRARVTGTDGTDGTSTGTVGDFTTVGTVTPTAAQLAAGSVTFVDNDVAVGVYRYRAALVNDGDQSAFQADPTNEASTAPAPDSTQPTISDTRLTTDNGFAGILDSGDVFTVRFNEQIAAPAAGATLRVQDIVASGSTSSVADLVNGTNATFALNAAAIPATPTTNPNAGAAAGTVLTVTLTGAPTVITAGSTPGVSIPAEIINTAGINDVGGNRVNVAATGDDRVIDTETTTTPPPTTVTPVANNVSTVTGVNGTQVLTVNFGAPVQCSSLAVGDFAFTIGAGAGSPITPTSFACTAPSDSSIEFTFPGTPFVTGNEGSATVAAGAVNNASGTPQTTSTARYTI